MPNRLTCHACGKVITADSEEELITLGQDHAREHGHTQPPDPEHVLAPIRRNTPNPP